MVPRRRKPLSEVRSISLEDFIDLYRRKLWKADELTHLGQDSLGSLVMVSPTQAYTPTRRLKPEPHLAYRITDLRLSDFWERNPTYTRKLYDQEAITPHAEIERWTYSTPADRNAIVVGFLSLTRRVANSTNGRAAADLEVDEVTVLRNRMWNNTVGAWQTVSLTFTMKESTKLDCDTLDGGSGAAGSIDYTLAAQITEFDA